MREIDKLLALMRKDAEEQVNRLQDRISIWRSEGYDSVHVTNIVYHAQEVNKLFTMLLAMEETKRYMGGA